MEIPHLDVLLRLIIAHLVADFVLQTNKVANGKKKGLRSIFFYRHILVVGATSYLLLLPDWWLWPVPLVVTFAHGFIDWLKSRFKTDTAWLYMADQALHIFSLIIIWGLFTGYDFSSLGEAIGEVATNKKVLIVATAYLIVTWPLGHLIGYMTGRWKDEVEEDVGLALVLEYRKSLPNAGKIIGINERILALTFILLNQWAPIGFLLTAKSVFRFGDLSKGSDRKKTEYILVGTLLSFMFSIITGIFTNFLLENI